MPIIPAERAMEKPSSNASLLRIWKSCHTYASWRKSSTIAEFVPNSAFETSHHLLPRSKHTAAAHDGSRKELVVRHSLSGQRSLYPRRIDTRWRIWLLSGVEVPT